MSTQASLQTMQQSLNALRENTISTTELCKTWRAQTGLLEQLPPQYKQVMEDILGRMEAGSLFTEESCSFSQEDLVTTLDMWLDNAERTLTSQ
jgi:predicted solute-binding protein